MPGGKTATNETQRTPRRMGFKIDANSVYELGEIADALGVSRTLLQDDCDNTILTPSKNRLSKTFVSGTALFRYLCGDEIP